EIIYRLRFKALHVPHCHPFKHGFYLTGAQPAPPFAEQAVRIPALYDALYQRGALLFLTFPFDSQVKGAFLCQQQM
ncbi:hypothetical protein, partial [Neisseria gonorrhoeae]